MMTTSDLPGSGRLADTMGVGASVGSQPPTPGSLPPRLSRILQRRIFLAEREEARQAVQAREGARSRVRRFGDSAIVVLEPGQSLDVALKVLKRKIQRAGIFVELKRRETFTPPSERRRLKSRAARKRVAKAVVRRALKVADAEWKPE